MDSIILILHIVTVESLVAFTGYKTWLLYRQKTDRFDRLRQITQPYFWIPLLLMVTTGGYLLAYRPDGLSTWLLVKFSVLLIATFLVQRGERRRHLPTMGIALALYLYVIALANLKEPLLRLPIGFTTTKAATNGSLSGNTTQKSIAGKTLYQQSCQSCHGREGNGGYLGAADLTTSQLTDAQMQGVIRQGKGRMPAFSDLSPAKVNTLMHYLRVLRQ